jgi:diaminopimelate decarboxylase
MGIQNNKLYFGNTSALSLAKKFGTPLYVYERATIKNRCQQLKKNFPGIALYYAAKANGNLEILKIIRQSGLGLEASSIGEIRLGKKAGFKKNQIIFTCPNLTEEEIVFAARNSQEVHLDSLHQLEVWGKRRLGAKVSLRINQGIGSAFHPHVVNGGPHSKFGITLDDLLQAERIAKKFGLTITGLHQQIGTNVLDVSTFLHSVEALLETTRRFPHVTHINFGGGLGVSYAPSDKVLPIEIVGKRFKKVIKTFTKETKRSMEFVLEPGRFVVADAGTLLVSVVDIKSTSAHTFIGVNSGFNHLLRPILYGAHHPIINASRSQGTQKKVNVAGYICEAGDLFAKDRLVVMPKIGDILAIQKVGAYGAVMGSEYIAHPRPKEVLI